MKAYNVHVIQVADCYTPANQLTKCSPHSTDMQNTGISGYVTKTLLTFWQFTSFYIVMFSEYWVLHQNRLSSLSQSSSTCTWLSPLHEIPFSLAQSLSVLRQELLQLPNLDTFVPYLQIVIFLCWHLAFESIFIVFSWFILPRCEKHPTSCSPKSFKWKSVAFGYRKTGGG